jgi:hypothetical protein
MKGDKKGDDPVSVSTYSQSEGQFNPGKTAVVSQNSYLRTQSSKWTLLGIVSQNKRCCHHFHE